MNGFGLILLGLILTADPVELPKDVYEVQARSFAMPLSIRTDLKDKVQTLRLYVSTDKGKTWMLNKEHGPDDEQTNFEAEKDGEYWFAVQVELKDGTREPAAIKGPQVGMKVFVNTERKTLKTQKSYEDLLSEVDELRKTVEQLQKKIKELEADKKDK